MAVFVESKLSLVLLPPTRHSSDAVAGEPHQRGKLTGYLVAQFFVERTEWNREVETCPRRGPIFEIGLRPQRFLDLEYRLREFCSDGLIGLSLGLEVEANLDTSRLSHQPDLVMNSGVSEVELEHPVGNPRTKSSPIRGQ